MSASGTMKFSINQGVLYGTREYAAIIPQAQRVEKSAKERDKISGDQTERGGGGEGGREKTACRLYLLSMGEAVPTLFKYLFVGSKVMGRKWLCSKGPKIA